MRQDAASARLRTSLVKEVPRRQGAAHKMERPRSTPLPNLATHRRRRGLTQRQLGRLAGVAHTTVQRLESLERGAYPRTLRKLAVALGVEPEALVGGDRR